MTTPNPSEMNEFTPFLTIADIAAEYPDVTRRVVTTWLANGLPSTTVGRTILIRRTDLDEWLATRVRKVTRWFLVEPKKQKRAS